MPRTAKWLRPGTTAEDLFDRATNLDLGFSYLRDLIDKYNGNTKLALLAYNRGPGTVDKILKRGGDPERISLSLVESPSGRPDVELIALEDALQRLSALDERKSRVVELKFFGGLTIEEIAEVLQVSGATVEREWAFARAWLYDAIEGSDGTGESATSP